MGALFESGVTGNAKAATCAEAGCDLIVVSMRVESMGFDPANRPAAGILNRTHDW